MNSKAKKMTHTKMTDDVAKIAYKPEWSVIKSDDFDTSYGHSMSHTCAYFHNLCKKIISNVLYF